MNQKISNERLVQQNQVTAITFSKSEEFCSIATKNNVKLLIFRVKDISNFDSWQLLQQIQDQQQPISEIDWSKDDKIISGSHDRSVFIYKKTGPTHWSKSLVNIDIKLSILCVKWAPSTKKFALGASCNTVAIGFYNVQSQCWTVSTRDKLCKAPIISLSFHPSSNILALGSTDNSVKIISCSFANSNDELIKKSNVEDKNYQGPFSNVNTLFQVLFSIENVGGWVNHVSFQLGGNFLLVLPHTNHFKIFDVIDQGGKVQTKQIDVKWNGLPFLSGFMSEKGQLYAGGFDKKVAVFNRSGNGFTFANFLQTNEKSSKIKSSKGLVSSMLSGMEKKGVTINVTEPSHADHVNSIKILQSPGKKYVVAYDYSGVIHFWC